MWIRLYVLVWTLVLPLALLRLLLRSLREPGYRVALGERLGLGAGRGTDPRADARTTCGALWCHAVSAGEVGACAPLLDRLRRALPERPLLLTTTTATGRTRAGTLAGAGGRVAWLPFDLPWCVDAFLDRHRPALLVLVERELWPVLIERCRRRGVPVVVASARLSARSARRYARVPGLVRPMLRRIDALCCADRATARRFAVLGVPPERLTVSGSLKFEPLVPPDLPARSAALRRQLAPGPEEVFLVVAGSTHGGEEAALLAALAPCLDSEGPRWRIVLVPRHPQRFEAVARLLGRRGLPVTRASAALAGDPAGVVLWDRMGDLFALYGAADAAFLGGSLVAAGGHNPVEGAWHGTPVVTGPDATNAPEVHRRLLDAGAVVQAADAAEVAAVLVRWARDPAERRRRGEAGRAAVRDAAGALAATTGAALALLQSPA